ncbi:hypothetical protein BH11CYA1_BH11CYA1_33910 [soil metagenome]
MNEQLPDDLILQPPAPPKQLPAGAEFNIGDVVGNSYQIVDYIGRGAMGYVYQAHHVRLPKEYALKTLSSEVITEVAWVRFQIEAQAIAKMFHPNIVGLHNFGLHKTIDGRERPFYVMDLLRGCNLMERLRDYDPPPVNTVLYIFLQAASGFGYAHSKGIIHRDVKPANIVLLDQPDATGSTIKIVDFGIVKLTADAEILGNHLANDDETLGSPYYMSPEQCLGRSVDARSDIYSLGVTFFETLTGEPPFVARSAVEIKNMHQNTPTPILNDFVENGDFSPAVQAVLEMMMAKDPDMRYQTMENVCSDLIAILQGDEPYYCFSPPTVDANGNICLPHTRTVVAPALNANALKPNNTIVGPAASGVIARPSAAPSPSPSPSLSHSPTPTPSPLPISQPFRPGATSTPPQMKAVGSESGITASLAEEGKALVRDALIRNGISLSDEAASISAQQRTQNSNNAKDAKVQAAKLKKLVLVMAAAAIVIGTGACAIFAWQTYQAACSRPKAPPRQVIAASKNRPEKVKVNPEEDTEPNESLTDTDAYADQQASSSKKMRVFNFPKDCLIGSIYAYDWKTKKERTVKARGTVEFAENEWLMYLPSRMVAKHPGYVLRFNKGDVAGVRLVDGSDSDAAFEACTAIPGIEELHIYDAHHLTSKCIPSLSKFTQINKFDGNNCSLDGNMLSKATCWTNIKDFQLSHGDNYAPILAKLKTAKKLEYLNLQHGQLNLQDYKALSELSTLQYLNLSYSRVTLNELKQLTKLNKLHTLIVIESGLDKKAIPVLKQFKGLKVLHVTTSSKTSQARDMFASGLPKVKVK